MRWKFVLVRIGVFGYGDVSVIANNIFSTRASVPVIDCSREIPAEFVSNDLFSESSRYFSEECGDEKLLSDNFFDDPGFVNAAWGDDRLRWDSANIDRGLDLGVLVDFEGYVRPLDGDGDGASGFDLGFDEFNPDTQAQTPSPTLAPTPTSTPRVAFCTGDCDGNNGVTIAELILAVRIALGAENQGSCSVLRTNAEGRVSIAELISAVGSSLYGCD